MAFDYSGLKADVIAIINELGTAGILREVTSPGTFDPVSGGLTGRTTVDRKCEYVKDTGSQFRFGGGTLQSNRTNYIISTKGLTNAPEVGHKLVIGGVELDISAVDPIKPGSTVLGWLVQVGG